MTKRRRIRMVHWNPGGASDEVGLLRDAGYTVIGTPFDGSALKELKSDPPDAVVIRLDRLPAQGRDVGIALRTNARTRFVPLVFVGGDEAKVKRTQTILPDAHYTPWSRIRSTVKRAIAHPPATPVVPHSNLAGYSGTPLPRKLGIRENDAVLLVNPPSGFENSLGALPTGVHFRYRAVGPCDLIIWFCPSLRDFQTRLERLGNLPSRGGIWIAWQKKASGRANDLSQTIVRSGGLEAGLVDYKICSIDEIWSALRFTRRK